MSKAQWNLPSSLRFCIFFLDIHHGNIYNVGVARFKKNAWDECFFIFALVKMHKLTDKIG